MEILATLESWSRSLTFIPIIACSVVGFAVTIDRWRQFARRVVPPEATLQVVRARVEAGDPKAARQAVESDVSRGAALLAAALDSAGRRRQAVNDRVAFAGRKVVGELERGLGVLALLASLGPLLGLLGTVVGIVLVFNRLAASGGVATPAELAGGIGTALFTTIAGIVVGILSLVFHRYFSARVERIVTELEGLGLLTVDLVAGEDP